jgi:FkbM family methyltransferase
MTKYIKNMFVLFSAFISIVLLLVARHHPPSRRKIKEIWHGRVYWESNTTMLRSSPEKVLENVEPTTAIPSESTNEYLADITSRLERPSPLNTKTMIAICAATHSKSSWRSLDDTTLQNTLIPSIRKTISSADRSNYDFRLYLAADHDDQFWLNNQNNVKTPDWLSVHIGVYDVPKHKIPFNPMMRAAYNDGAEYMVRINDDSEFVTTDWVSKAVAKLATYDPPNVGMVGPNCREGNTDIMTHDMVHRTHLDIFEHYYPDVFSAWWIDDWISKVYGPQRSTKMMDWTVKHHVHKHGTRYAVQHHEAKLLKGELEKGAAKIEAWLSKTDKSEPNMRVISYSLYGSNPRYTDGAIANAKLMKEIYPGWDMRVYYDNSVPMEIIEQLKELQVQLVDMTNSKMNKMSWRFQAASDAKRFCARDIDSRLSKREAAAVEEWVQSGKQFHVMRDHPSHSKYAMSGGMWCSTTIPNIEKLLTDVRNQAYLQDMNFLNKVIWPMAQNSLVQHDSFSCDKFGGGKPFPTPRVGWEHVGSVYINGKMRQGDVDILKRSKQPCVMRDSQLQKCIPKSNVPYRSQSNEDKAIVEQLYGGQPKCGGTIVEIGALDGVRYSNSWYFEQALQWKALLIEANPRNFKALQINRPNALNVHSAMCTSESIDFIGSGAVGGMVNTMSEKHKNGWVNPKEKSVSVPCQTFKPLFSKHGIHHVDIFILDVEGGEFEVLKTMDWSVTVGVWVVELDKGDPQKDHDVREELRKHGYTPATWNIRDWCSKGGDCTLNEVFVPTKKELTDEVKAGEVLVPDLHQGKTRRTDFITNKKYIAMCDVSYKTRSKNDFTLPLKPDSVVCAKGDTATLTAFFMLDIQVPFTLITIEMDDAVPQNLKWLEHKYLKKWYSWNSKHPDITPIPIGLNEVSQLAPMTQAKPVYPKIEKILINFRQDRTERQQLFSQVKDLPFVHVESYSKKWHNAQDMISHYESISKYKWTLCPRGAGEDTHRLWEALYLGSIPIVLKSTISQLYKGLPVVQLDTWDELSLDMLRERSKSLPNDRTNAYFKNWINLIKYKTVSSIKKGDKTVQKSVTNKVTVSQYNEKLLHTFFIGGTIPKIVVIGLQSALRLQKDATIILWTESSRVASFEKQLIPVREKFQCNSHANLVVKSLSDIYEKLKNSTNKYVNSRKCKIDKSQPVAASDWFRFMVLWFYGGIYFDADTLFLKDMDPWHKKSKYGFAFKWGGEGPIPVLKNTISNQFDTAIMGLPQYASVVSQIIKASGQCNNNVFHPTIVSKHLGCEKRDVMCDGLAMVPSSAFDPIQQPNRVEKWLGYEESFGKMFGSGDRFFTEPAPFDIEHFYPAAWAYHWHNRWTIKIHPESLWSKLVELNSNCEPPPPSEDLQLSEDHPQNSAAHHRKVFVDIGGWKGDTLALYGKYFLENDNFPNSGVTYTKEAYVFEANANNIKVILNKYNGDYSGDSMQRVGDELLPKMKKYTTIINGAAFNKDEVVNFGNAGGNGNAGNIQKSSKGFQTLSYDIGPWFLKTIKPKDNDLIVVKIDIEGAEVQAIESLDKCGAFEFIDLVVIEWHDWLMPNVKHAKSRLESLMLKYGIKYQWATLDDKLSKHFKERNTWPVNHCDSHYFRDDDIRWSTLGNFDGLTHHVQAKEKQCKPIVYTTQHEINFATFDGHVPRADGDEAMQAIVEGLVGEPSEGIVVDIGGLFGDFGIRSAKTLHRKTLIFEPQYCFAKLIDATIATNKLAEYVSVRNVAVSSQTQIAIKVSAHPGQTSAGGQGDLVPAVTLDNITREQSIFMLKIDVEGFEGDVLKSGQKSIQQHRVHHIVLEYTPFQFRGRGTDFKSMLPMLYKAGAKRCFALHRTKPEIFLLSRSDAELFYQTMLHRHMQTDIYCSFVDSPICPTKTCYKWNTGVSLVGGGNWQPVEEESDIIQYKKQIKPNIWISMSLCLDSTAEKVPQFYYSEAAVWATKLWKSFQKKVIITVVTKNDNWEDNTFVKRLQKNGAVVVRRKPMEKFSCITTSQFARMWAFENEVIQQQDIIILTDVDAFPTSNDVFNPLTSYPSAKAWIWQYTYSAKTGYTFPMAIIALRKLEFKNILGQYGTSNALLQSMDYNNLEEHKYKENIWGIDQRVITNALLKNKICSITNPKVWTRVKLEPTPFQDVNSCWHGTENTRHGPNKSWLHLTATSNAKKIAESILISNENVRLPTTLITKNGNDVTPSASQATVATAVNNNGKLYNE